MSEPVPAPAPAPPPATPSRPSPPVEVKVYSHSNLFYWWPVWLIGLILAGLTAFQPNVMVLVPKGSEIRDVTFTDKDGKPVKRPAVVLPEGKEFPEKGEPHLNITAHRGYGVLFVTVLLVVIFITNVPLRGMWSVMIIMAIVMLSIIFALAGWWDKILGAIRILDIRINMAGYLFISLGLLGLWCFAFFFFDRQIYITFQPGAMKVRLAIGEGERQYDTIGMNIEKERSDFFRHRLLGAVMGGSGDLVVRTSGADRHEFRLTNVMAINRTLQAIEDMQRIRQERSA
jgi:hypothetical protein